MYYALENSGQKAEALNSLIEAVKYYKDDEERIALLGLAFETEQQMKVIYDLLLNNYNLSSDEIDEILLLDSVSYTYKLRELAGVSVNANGDASVSGNSIPDTNADNDTSGVNKEDDSQNASEEENQENISLDDLLENEMD